MISFIRLTTRFFLTCLGLVLIGALPQLLNHSGGVVFSVPNYLEGLKIIFNSLINLNEITYSVKGNERDLFPFIFGPILYSLTILGIVYLLTIVLSLILTFFTMLMPINFISRIKYLVNVLESFPDILVITSFQIFIVYLYKKTGVLFLNFVSFDENAYALPIICLSILPTIQFYKLMILIFQDELEKNYTELAKGKGLKMGSVLFFHVFRNALVSLFYHSKSVIWFMLTNLLILEYLFNMNGITQFLFMYFTPDIFFIGLFLLFFPVFVMYFVGEIILNRWGGHKSI